MTLKCLWIVIEIAENASRDWTRKIQLNFQIKFLFLRRRRSLLLLWMGLWKSAPTTVTQIFLWQFVSVHYCQLRSKLWPPTICSRRFQLIADFPLRIPAELIELVRSPCRSSRQSSREIDGETSCDFSWEHEKIFPSRTAYWAETLWFTISVTTRAHPNQYVPHISAMMISLARGAIHIPVRCPRVVAIFFIDRRRCRGNQFFCCFYGHAAGANVRLITSRSV